MANGSISGLNNIKAVPLKRGWMGQFAKRHDIAAKTLKYSAPALGGAAAGVLDLVFSYGVFRASLALSVPLGIAALGWLVNRVSRNIQIEEREILQARLDAGIDDMFAAAGMRYQLIEELDRGEQAIVLLVRDHGMPKKPIRVLKVPRLRQPKKTDLKKLLERFETEVENLDVLRDVKHPNIVEFYHADKLSLADYNRLTNENIVSEEVEGIGVEKFPCFLMERVKGENLKTKLAARRKEGIGFRLSYAIDIFLKGISAIKAMKEKNIIHRDIKPGNIVETLEEVIKLIDFGIARGEEGTGTIDGATLGTEGYMAPEQRRKEVRDSFKEKYGIEKLEVAAPTTDQFGLAATIRELLTLERPFAKDESILEMELPNIESELADHPDRLVEDLGPNDPANVLQQSLLRLRRKLIEKLNYIFQKTLAVDPQKRYQDLEKLEQDLELVLKYNNQYQKRLKTFNRLRPASESYTPEDSTPSDASEGTAVHAGFFDKKEGE